MKYYILAVMQCLQKLIMNIMTKKCIDLIYDTKRYILFTSRKSWRNIDYQQLKQKMAVYLSKKKNIYISLNILYFLISTQNI